MEPPPSTVEPCYPGSLLPEALLTPQGPTSCRHLREVWPGPLGSLTSSSAGICVVLRQDWRRGSGLRPQGLGTTLWGLHGRLREGRSPSALRHCPPAAFPASPTPLPRVTLGGYFAAINPCPGWETLLPDLRGLRPRAIRHGVRPAGRWVEKAVSQGTGTGWGLFPFPTSWGKQSPAEKAPRLLSRHEDKCARGQNENHKQWSSRGAWTAVRRGHTPRGRGGGSLQHSGLCQMAPVTPGVRPNSVPGRPSAALATSPGITSGCQPMACMQEVASWALILLPVTCQTSQLPPLQVPHGCKCVHGVQAVSDRPCEATAGAQSCFSVDVFSPQSLSGPTLAWKH